MARVVYFDCYSGISGDMVLGACLDAGLPFDELKAALGSLAMSGYDIRAQKVLRCGLAATKFDVLEPAREVGAGTGVRHGHAREAEHAHAHTNDAPAHAHERGDAHQPHTHAHRGVREIEQLIDGSALPAAGRTRAKTLVRRLAETEAAIHQMAVDDVQLHEVGAIDSIVDIVGAVFALEWLRADRIVCSPLNVGSGTVRTAHGILPVPAPATLRLLGNAPIYSRGPSAELVTPTGALIATAYASDYGPMPPLSVEQVGYGAGTRDHSESPNVLRIVIGQAADRAEVDRVVMLECEIDDMNPQIFGIVMDRLYAAGALDVYYVPVQMKKNRPGTLITVVSPPDRREALSSIIFGETTTIGLRAHEVERECLPREMVTVETPLGPIRFKVARRGGRVVNASPEFEDCARLAAAHGRTVKDVQALAIQCFGGRVGQSDGWTS
jgi:pyridinium-3,5-bisthiocarboxylic acid mononucleotide nickel chelatase